MKLNRGVALLQVSAEVAVESLFPKIWLNLGICLEAEGCLDKACDSYRWGGQWCWA